MIRDARTVSVGHKQATSGGYDAFVPGPFAPADLLPLPGYLIDKAKIAERKLSELNSVAACLPDADYVLQMFLRKESTASSRIEGTVATLSDAIEAEICRREWIPEDVGDIHRCLQSLRHGFHRLSVDGFPVSLRLLREVHSFLMASSPNASSVNPGEFRLSQNWIGGSSPENASLVPPPASEIVRALGDIETFIHVQDAMPVVLKAGMIHAQFETIHPFLDGNGRVGRILLLLHLVSAGTLVSPFLFLSSYFLRHQETYYELLSGYHKGHVFEWLDFFLDGVISTGEIATGLVNMVVAFRDDALASCYTGDASASYHCKDILPLLLSQPIVNMNTVSLWTGLPKLESRELLDKLSTEGVLSPLERPAGDDEAYVCRDYLELFESAM